MVRIYSAEISQIIKYLNTGVRTSASDPSYACLFGFLNCKLHTKSPCNLKNLKITNQSHNIALTDPRPFRASTRAVEGVSFTTTGVAFPSQTSDCTSFMYISVMCNSLTSKAYSNLNIQQVTSLEDTTVW